MGVELTAWNRPVVGNVVDAFRPAALIGRHHGRGAVLDVNKVEPCFRVDGKCLAGDYFSGAR